MRYYKQFHNWSFVPVASLLVGFACVFLAAFLRTDIDARAIFFSCGIVFIISGWIVRKGQTHYIEINEERIIHRGFRQWTIMKSDVTRIERGRKGWLDDNELYLKVYVRQKSYDIDDGFLSDEEQAQKLASAIGS